MIEVESLTVTVYRSKVGREKRFRRKDAYLDAAWFAWKSKVPCTCEDSNPESLYECKAHKYEDDLSYGGIVRDEEWAKYRRKVIARLARWLMWRDSKMKVKP